MHVATLINTTLFYAVAIMKPKGMQCMCSQGQILQQNHRNNVVEHSSKGTFAMAFLTIVLKMLSSQCK